MKLLFQFQESLSFILNTYIDSSVAITFLRNAELWSCVNEPRQTANGITFMVCGLPYRKMRLSITVLSG